MQLDPFPVQLLLDNELVTAHKFNGVLDTLRWTLAKHRRKSSEQLYRFLVIVKAPHRIPEFIRDTFQVRTGVE